MSCSLNAFKSRFPGIKGNEVEVSGSKEDISLIQWTTVANNQAKAQGFGPELFSMEYVDEAISKVTANINNLALYDAFMEKEYLPQMELSKTVEQDFMSEDFEEDTESDVSMTEKRNQQIQYDYDGILGAFMNNPEPQEPHITGPINYREWRSTLEGLRKQLLANKLKLLVRKDQSKLKSINATLKTIETDLAEFDELDPEVVMQSVVNQIESLEKILDNPDKDPIVLANAIQSNMVKERLEFLRGMFEENHTGGDTSLAELFRSGFKDNSSIVSRIVSIANKYDNSMDTIMYGIMSSNEYIVELKKSFTTAEEIEQWEKYDAKVKELLDKNNPADDRDSDKFFGFYFLGANAYDSIITNMLGLARDINNAKEAGIVNVWTAKLAAAEQKLSLLTSVIDGYTVPFIDRLFQKNVFGDVTDNLISPFTSTFFSKKKVIKAAQRDFFSKGNNSTRKLKSYKVWMQTLKNNTDFIQVHKLASFVNKHSAVEDFAPYFKYSEAEMADYEAEMREKLGDITFEMELEKQSSAIENFLLDEFETRREGKQKNPLGFLEHFYSENFDGYDEIGNLPIPVSTYTRFMPKVDNADFFNEDFKELVQENVDGFKDFYTNANNLSEYVQDSLKSVGQESDGSIIALEDAAGRTAIEDLKFFGKVNLALKLAYRGMTNPYYEGSSENPNRREDYDIDKERNLKTKYNENIKRNRDVAAKTYVRKPFQELVDIANEVGLTVPDVYLKESAASRQIIADGIARRKFSKGASMDLYKRLMFATEIAKSINTREGTRSLVSLAKDYAKSRKLTNTENYLKIWEAQNILKVGSLYHTKGMTKNENKKVKRVLGFKTKRYSEAEKILKDIIEKEKGNLNGENYKFSATKTSYYTQKGIHYKKELEGKPIPIELSEVQDAYEEYLKKVLEELGNHPTYGTIFQGLAWNMFKTLLFINPMSGFRNRVQGYNQNNQIAASGNWGYTMDNLWVSRRFLTGVGYDKIVSYSPGLKRISNRFGPGNVKKQQQWEIMAHLATRLGLLNNVQSDLEGGESVSSLFGRSTLVGSIGEFMSDFAMNIPEMHNQFESLISMMQNTKIEMYTDSSRTTISSETRPLFDPKTMTFALDPNTMELLPEYDTPNNRLNWVEFKKDTEGNSKHTIMLQKYQKARDAANGNYKTEDKVAIQSTMTGRAATTFMKWIYEAINLQYGNKRADPLTGRANVQGRKLVLMKSAPMLTTHLVLNNIGPVSLITGGWALVSGSVALGSVGGYTTAALAGLLASPFVGAIGVAGSLVLAHRIYQNRKNLKWAKEDWKTSWMYFTEVLARSVKTNIATVTKGRVTLGTDAQLSEYLGLTKEKWKATGMTLEERKQMSENAQELADKYNLYISFAILGVALQGASLMLKALAADDEDDEGKFSFYRAALENLDKRFMYLINQRDMLTSDVSRNTNPMDIKDTVDEIILLKHLTDNGKSFIKSGVDYSEGKIGMQQMLVTQTQAVAGTLVGLPKQATDLVNPKSNIFQSEGYYQGTEPTVLDMYMANMLKVGDDKYKSIVRQKRNKTKFVIQDIYETRIRKSGMTIPKGETVKSLAEKNVQANFKANGAEKKRNKGTYEQVYENAKWDNMVNYAEESPLIMSKKAATTGVKRKKGGMRD